MSKNDVTVLFTVNRERVEETERRLRMFMNTHHHGREYRITKSDVVINDRPLVQVTAGTVS